MRRAEQITSFQPDGCILTLGLGAKFTIFPAFFAVSGEFGQRTVRRRLEPQPYLGCLFCDGYIGNTPQLAVLSTRVSVGQFPLPPKSMLEKGLPAQVDLLTSENFQ